MKKLLSAMSLIVLGIFLSSQSVMAYGFIGSKSSYVDFDESGYTDYKGIDYNEVNDGTEGVYFDHSGSSSSKNSYVQKSYVYDYPKEYYDIQDNLHFYEDKCYTENSVKYCKVKFLNKDLYNIYYKRYNCRYNLQKKGTYCRFAFKKQKRYVGPKISTEEIEKYLPTYKNYYDDYGYKIYYVPRNAQLTNNGQSWKCNWGYEKSDYGSYCKKIKIPKNAHINKTGDGYECNFGYKKDSYGDYCSKIELPTNAVLDSTGRDWKCEWGYKKDLYRDACIKTTNTYNNNSDYYNSYGYNYGYGW